MPAQASKAKSQQPSIMSFFGGAAATSTKKRKAVEEEHEEASSPPKPKQAKTVKIKKTKKEEEDASDQAEEELEENMGQDEESKEKEEQPEAVMEEDESPEPSPVKTKPKDGRRRLRQRVAEKSDENSDDELDFISASKNKKEPSSKADPIAIASDDDDDDDDEVVETVATKEETFSTAEETTKDEPKQSPKQETSSRSVATKSPVKPKNNPAEKSSSAQSPSRDQQEQKATSSTPVKADKSPSATKKAKSSSSASSFFSPKPTSKVKSSSNASTPSKKQAEPPAVSDGSDTAVAYSALAELFTKIEEASKRLEIQDLLCDFFHTIIQDYPQDLLSTIYLCVCTDLRPPFENLKIGIGDSILIKAIGEATGTNVRFIKETYQKEGDLGTLAMSARSKQHTISFGAASGAPKKANTLTVQNVYNQFVKIAKMTGNNSQQQKCSIIKSLLVKCEKEEDKGRAKAAAKFIIRGLQGKLRIGLAEKSILMSLTYAFMRPNDRKDKEKQAKALAYVKRAFAECPSYDALITAFQETQATLEEPKLWLRVEDFETVANKCLLTPGIPVSPMLARPTKAYAMVFDRFQNMPFTCEYKYDGERAQIHLQSDGTVSIFSRNFENSTERFPDVCRVVKEAVKKGQLTSCILDAEVVAVDRASKKRLPFQILSTRSRKNVKEEDIKVPVCIYAFDLLFLNGESLLTTQLQRRREMLRDCFAVKDGDFEFATSMDVESHVAQKDGKDDAEALEAAVDTIRTFLEKAVEENCEGLMVKTLEQEATYEPANRSHKWLKVKKDYLDGIGDSTDLVPIGAFYGKGKRTGVYGAYLLACYDPDTELFEPITKLGTGLSDEVLKQFFEQLKESTVDKAPTEYSIGDGAIKPDVWFEPSTVWEILGADLSISPKYTAAMGHVARDKGISLRFPRFIRVRDDKDPTQATTSSQVADLYRAQGTVTAAGADDGDDDMLI